jgi:1,4-dihydroxy-2-naphthoate octaprenyltransferase
VFLLALAGLASTVCAVIIPTEIRDYFVDKAMGIETMTVRLGLVKASLLSMILLSIGGLLIGLAFFLTFTYGQYFQLSPLVLAIAVIDLLMLHKFKKLYTLAQEYENSCNQQFIAEKITDLSANNPKWIMLVTQTYSCISIVMLVSKFLEYTHT